MKDVFGVLPNKMGFASGLSKHGKGLIPTELLRLVLHSTPRSYPILDTRISVLLSPSGYPPLDSETGWTGDLWSMTNLLK